MMKNLLILTLVLGMASMANAAMVSTVGGGQVAWGSNVVAGTLGLDETATTLAYDISITAGGDVGMSYGGIAYPLVFDFASAIVGTPTATYVRISGSEFMSPASGPGSLITGIAFTGTAGTLTFYDFMTSASLGTINVVPEPMTIALLGLGGLFLLRRRK